MNNEQNECIEKIYSNHIWVTDNHRKILYEKKRELNLSDSEIQDLFEKNTSAAKTLFKNVFRRMGNKKAYYSIPQCIFKVGDESEVVIACKYNFQRLVGKFKVVIVPFYNYNYKIDKDYEPFSTIIEADGNALHIPYCFEEEDMYTISVFLVFDEEEMLLLTSNIYALNDDLFDYGFFKADLHMHTTHSDGYEPPELVVASARERGMDIIAVTDHNAFSGSVAARERAAEMGLNMTVILGEEYSLEYSPMHILSLGTKEAIDRKYVTKQLLSMPETQEIIKANVHRPCSVEAFACTQVLLEQVSKLGGISILAHPYWKPISSYGSRKDTPESLFVELGKDRKFSGIEIVSGSPEGGFDTSMLQASLARSILESFEGIPVIGITDSHSYSTDPITGHHFTLIFAKTKAETDVIEALKKGNCVAVELVKGTPLCFGSHRLIKLSEFLLKYYFPERDIRAKIEAAMAKENHLYSEYNRGIGK